MGGIVKTVKQYFWPQLPRRIGAESSAAMRADLADKGVFSADLDDRHRRKVGVWTRHADNLARAENREWLKHHARTFARRWAVLAACLWTVAAIAEGQLVLEVPLTLSGCAAVVVACVFWYESRALNRSSK